MRTIERYYLNQVMSYWLILSSLIVGMQSLLSASKEYQKISEQYTTSMWWHYVSSDALGLFLDIAPIAIFLSVVLTHWQWSKKSLWLSAALSGQNSGSWFKVMACHILILSSFLLSVRYWVWPDLYYKASSERLIALGRMPAVGNKNNLEALGSFLSYYDNSGHLSLFDIHSKNPSPINTENDFIERQTLSHQIKVDVKVGLSSVPLKKKIAYKKEAGDIEKRFLHGAIIKDALYPILIVCAVILGWRDSPIQWSKRQATLSPIKITLSLTVLYMSLKIVPLATLFFKPGQVIWAVVLLLTGIMFSSRKELTAA